jgi:hypothetical protein
VFAPLVLRVVRSSRLADAGAHWATTADLRRAKLLVADQLLAHAAAEEPSVEA